MAKNLIKINIRGGILSPGELRNILEIAKYCGCADLHLGERQNIYLHIPVNLLNYVQENLVNINSDFEIDNNLFPNIVTSYFSEGIFTTYNNWVSEGVYHDILDSFNFRPTLKINIVDKGQTLVPLFSGNLNFISSDSPNFWYLYVRKKSATQQECWPQLIYSTEISTISQLIEKELMTDPEINIATLVQRISEGHRLITLDLQNELIIPRFKLPYYEGLNKSDNHYWLGIYRRNNDFPIEFLESLCDICFQTKLGLVQITPWKTVLIKGIIEDHRFIWEKLLGKYGINIRHSSLELNWQIKDGDKEAVKLKKFLVKKLDKSDIRTFGLSFAVKTGPMNVAASVLIERIYTEGNLAGETIIKYAISYADQFNPNYQTFTLFATEVSKKKLPQQIKKLCKFYYNQLNNAPVITSTVNNEDKEYQPVYQVHQCKYCYTIYDPAYGDDHNRILRGTTFQDLPETYKCPVCESNKEAFVLLEWPQTGKIAG